MKTKTLFTVILVMVAAMTVAPEVSAQEQEEEYKLEEITVTATKRETALEDTALAISVVTGDMINEQGRSDIIDILKDVSGISFNVEAYGVGFNIRGIAGGIPAKQHGDPAMATNIDGGYASPLIGNALNLSFYDIARVEVLRGPQGTLYGRNAEGGVLNVVTNDPSDTAEASGTIELGTYHLIHGSGMVNAPLTENSALRIAFNHYDRNAYTTAGGGSNTASGRLKYLYQPGDALRLIVGGEFSKGGGAYAMTTTTAYGLGDYPAGDPYDNLTRDGGLTGTLKSSGSSDERYAKVWAQVDWETPIGTVTYLPTYTERVDNDVSASLQNRFVPDILKQTWVFTKSHQNSFEARLASSGESAFDYVLGIFYLDAEWSEVYILTGGATEDLTMVGQGSEAVFGQGTYDLTDRLRGTLGLRYTRDSKDYYTTQILYGDNAANGGKKAWTRTDWKVGLEMDILEDGLLYADVATGYRPGTVNTSAALTGFDAEGNVIDYPNQFTEPEKLLAYEMGAKTSFFNKRLTVNLDAYFYDYNNRQYTELFPGVPLDQLCPSGTKPSEKASMRPGTGLCYEERNMGKVTTYGAELSSVMRPTDNDTINLSVAYLKAYVAEHQMILVHMSGLYADANGATMPNSPEWDVNLGYEHRFDFEPGSLLLRGDGGYTSESFVQDFTYLAPLSTTLIYPYPTGVTRTYSYRDLYTCEAHTSYDFTATFLASEGGYTVSAYVKNITDKYWKIRTDGFTGNVISEPRTYGVTFSARF